MARVGGSRINATLAAIFLLLFCSARTFAQSSGHDSPDPARTLSQQVWALQTLHDLDLDAAQLQALRASSPKLEEDPAPHARSRVPARYLATLESLRQALLNDREGADLKEQIDDLRDDLESMQEDERIELDDRVSIADAARAAVPMFMKTIQPSQLVGYLAAYQDEIPDPVQTLTNAAEESRGLDEGKFNALVEQTAKDVGILAAGLDKDKAAAVCDRVRQWLTQNRALSPADYRAASPQLPTSAKTVIGELDSFDVLRHWIERDVAELLSNPQLGAVIDERIKRATK